MSQLKARRQAVPGLERGAIEAAHHGVRTSHRRGQQKSKTVKLAHILVLCIAVISLRLIMTAIGITQEGTGRVLRSDELDELTNPDSAPTLDSQVENLFEKTDNNLKVINRPRGYSDTKWVSKPRAVRGQRKSSEKERRLGNGHRNIFRRFRWDRRGDGGGGMGGGGGGGMGGGGGGMGGGGGGMGGGGMGGGGMGGGGGVDDILDNVDVEEVVDATYRLGSAIYQNILKYTPTCFPPPAPTSSPSSCPTEVPTVSPSLTPTNQPSVSAEPSMLPSQVPSMLPSDSAVPSHVPSSSPSLVPTGVPSSVPSLVPTGMPSSVPSLAPTGVPSSVPSMAPTGVPTVATDAEGLLGEPATSSGGSATEAKTEGIDSAKLSAPSAIPSVAPSRSRSWLPSRVPSARPSHESIDDEEEESSFDFGTGEDSARGSFP